MVLRSPMNKYINRKITYFYGPCSSTPCLITGGYKIGVGMLLECSNLSSIRTIIYKCDEVAVFVHSSDGSISFGMMILKFQDFQVEVETNQDACFPCVIRVTFKLFRILFPHKPASFYSCGEATKISLFCRISMPCL